MNDLVKQYWHERFSQSDAISHHRTQNRLISRDFLRQARQHPRFQEALGGERIIEIGCGTGELSAMIRDRFNPRVLAATDYSRDAVEIATKRHELVIFWVYDILRDDLFGDFDLAIASNMLEHFRRPFVVLDKMLALAPKVIVLVPYRQEVTDGYDGEGGAGHVAKFSKKSFAGSYKLLGAFTFQTAGWQHSSHTEKPLQLAVLLARRDA